MKRVFYFALLSLLITSSMMSDTLMAQSAFRRGNSHVKYYARSLFYIVDSDDNSPFAPSYNFVDTNYGSWMRLTNWPNTDNSCDTVPLTYDSILFSYFIENLEILQPPHQYPGPLQTTITFPGSFVSTNGAVCLNGLDSSPVNEALPSPQATADMVAALWADWEFRTSDDSTKVFVRATTDSFYVSFYNLGLKGTNGQVRATFEVAFASSDSSITFTYKSFDGSFGGVSAAALIQQVATIGLGDQVYGDGAMYLHKGYYFASNPNSQYNQPLHNHLAIRFLRMNQEAFLVAGATMPPNDRYELSSTQMVPQCAILNTADTSIKVMVLTTITNLTTGISPYSRHDSIIAPGNEQLTTYTAPMASGLTCGSYKITFTISYANNVSDEWADNNTLTRYFVALSPQSVPFRDEFDGGLSTCSWSNAGADVRSAYTIFRVPCAPISTGSGPKAVVMNRLDANGNPYPIDVGGDTLTSAPIDLSQSAKVHLSFHYQRGLSSDSTQAGIFSRLLSGPEIPVPGAQGGMAQVGDSLIIEGLNRSGQKWNPSESDWAVLGVIPGGFDLKLQTFRVLLDTSFLHNHFRVRLRMKAHNSESPNNYFEDADNFVIDAVHIEPLLTERAELEPIDVDLGNGFYTSVPRNLSSFLIPKVRILNNGDQVLGGVCQLHLTILDALDRIVYDQTKQIAFPQSLMDSLYEMPQWNIQGSQGPSFTAYVTLLDNYFEIYPANDTNIFHKSMAIADVYGIDDGLPDTVGTTTAPPANFFYDFTSIMSSGFDTLRGVDIYYKGPSSTSNWTLTIVGNGDSAVHTWTVTPNASGWYRGSFAPYDMAAGSVYRLHFVMTGGSNVGGDASNGLVYYTYVDSTTPKNNLYGELRPDILGLFHNSSRVSYIPPSEATAYAGGYLLPMFRLVTGGAASFLPIELVSLNAHRTENMNSNNRGSRAILNWQTADEDGVAEYKIERAETGEIAGSVPASGNTANEPQSYEFIDTNAPAASIHYRLSAIMRDGSESKLGEVLLAPVSQDGQFSIEAYPNPASDEITIISSSNIDAIEVVDLLGRTVGAIAKNDGMVTMDLHGIPDGIYSIIAKSGDNIALRRISITR